MPEVNAAALNFLLNRRSRPAKTLSLVGPDRAELEVILTAAARTPDHGKLEPFRFIVITGDAQTRMSEAVRSEMTKGGEDADKIDKQSRAMTYGGIVVAVICKPKPSKKVPDWEQHLAAGGACLALLNAALASGWGANWLTGWASQSRWFMETQLELTAEEFVAGFIHIGQETVKPPDRPRPDVRALTTWVDA